MTHHGVGADLEGPSDIAHPRAIECHFVNLVFGAWFPGIVAVGELEGFLAAFAAIALGAIFAMAIFDEVVCLAVATMKLDELFHGSFWSPIYDINGLTALPASALFERWYLWWCILSKCRELAAADT